MDWAYLRQSWMQVYKHFSGFFWRRHHEIHVWQRVRFFKEVLLRECTELGEKQGLRFSYEQALYRTSQSKEAFGKFQNKR